MTTNLPAATKWEIYTLDDIIELADDESDLEITNHKEAISYLEARNDNYYEVLPNRDFSILFG